MPGNYSGPLSRADALDALKALYSGIDPGGEAYFRLKSTSPDANGSSITYDGDDARVKYGRVQYNRRYSEELVLRPRGSDYVVIDHVVKESRL